EAVSVKFRPLIGMQHYLNAIGGAVVHHIAVFATLRKVFRRKYLPGHYGFTGLALKGFITGVPLATAGLTALSVMGSTYFTVGSMATSALVSMAFWPYT